MHAILANKGSRTGHLVIVRGAGRGALRDIAKIVNLVTLLPTGRYMLGSHNSYADGVNW